MFFSKVYLKITLRSFLLKMYIVPKLGSDASGHFVASRSPRKKSGIRQEANQHLIVQPFYCTIKNKIKRALFQKPTFKKEYNLR